MQVSKWGNSLAVRLPAVIVKALELKAGDEVEVEMAGAKRFVVSRDASRQRALERLREFSKRHPVPAGFKFDRDELYER
jgi:antitoxin MazE